MKIKKILVPLIAIVILIVMIVFIQSKLISIRQQENLITYSLSEELPPGIAFINVGLGAFKGIFSDILWLKAISLQEQGKFFEVGKIAFWITKLNPQFTGATCFMAWNMAYNISIMYANPSDKWKWVENAINVLREAIAYNPNSPDLYKELAWIYLNKISDAYDSGNLYYKTKIASEMQNIIGINPSIEYWKDLESKSSDTQRLEVNRILKDKFSIEPVYINQINSKFGLLDWRTPQSISAYWAYRATLIAPKDKTYSKIMYMALTSYAYTGKIIYMNLNNDSLYTSIPNFEMIQDLNNYFQKELQSEDGAQWANFYYTFLEKALRECCLYGNFKLARILLDSSMKTFSSFQFPDLKTYLDNMILTNLSNLNENDFIKEMREHVKTGIILLKENNDSSQAKEILNAWNMFYDQYLLHNPSTGLKPFKAYFDEEKDLLLKEMN